MSDPFQTLFQPSPLTTNLFAPNSRYYGIATATDPSRDGRTIVYIRRRFIPPPETFSLLTEHTIAQGERLDTLSAQYLGDPEQFWRIADANNVIAPNELIERTGQRIRITLPAGIPGATQ